MRKLGDDMKTDTYTPTKIETWPVKEYEAVKVWRETKERQCTALYMEDGAYCALGVLGKTDCPDFDAYEIPTGRNNQWKCPHCEDYLDAGFYMVTHWNDGHRFSFKEIADLAEAYPHLVFTEAQS